MQKLVIRDRKGFTLLELLVVITILAILATVAIPYFQKEIGNARNSTRIADITTLSNKLSQADAGVPLNLTLISKEFQNGIPVDPKNKFGYQFNVSLI